MPKLSLARRAEILQCLVDGASIRTAARVCQTSKATVLKLLVDVGKFCSAYQDLCIRELHCPKYETSEIWAFRVGGVGNSTTGYGEDIWTFTASCAESGLILTWFVGARSIVNAGTFLADVTARLSTEPDIGAPECAREWRFNRLANGSSTRAENHLCAISLHFMHHNFCQIQRGARKAQRGAQKTPAMAAGITDRAWVLEDILRVMGTSAWEHLPDPDASLRV